MNTSQPSPSERELARLSLRLAFLCIAWVAAAWFASSSAYAQTAADPPPTNPGMKVDIPVGIAAQGPTFATLRTRIASTNRKVRVIARVAPAATASPAAAAVTTQPGLAVTDTPQLRATRDRLLTRMTGLGVEAPTSIDGTAFVVLDVDANQLDQLVANGEVAEVQEDVPVPPTLQDSGPLVHAPQARALGTRGAGTTVAIIDTGVQSNHPFLNGRIVEEACFSTTSSASNSTSLCPGGVSTSTAAGSGAPCSMSGCNHGTHVAGIAAGRAFGATTFFGMAPDANVFPMMVFSRFTDTPANQPCANASVTSPCLLSFTSDQIRGLQHALDRRAARNIVAVNMSLGGGKSTTACDTDSRKSLIDSLKAVNVATVIASGNSGFTDGVGAPGCISTAVTVGSTTKTDGISSFSNSSALVDILAPGSSINSSIPTSTFGIMSGTSMATPHVTGAYAVMRSVAPNASVDDVLAALQATGVAITDPRNSVTKSRINLEAAVNRLAPQPFALPFGGIYQLHDDGTIWVGTGVACTGNSCPGWVELDNNRATTSIAAASNQLYQLHNDGTIWRYTGTRCGGAACPGWQRLDNNTATVQIAAGGNALYQRHNTGKIWRYTGTPCNGNSCPGWTMLDNNPASVDIAADANNLYQRHNTGKIWKSSGVACSGNSCPGWTMFDNNPASIAIAAAGGQLFQLHNTGRIWRSTGTACSGNSCPGWTMLDNNPAAVEIDASTNGFFQRHNDGSIWRSTGAACNGNSCPGWTELDNNHAGAQITATGSGLYQRHNTGLIWRSTGTACTGASCPGWTMLDNNAHTRTIVGAQP